MPMTYKMKDTDEYISGIIISEDEAKALYKMASNGRDYVDDQEWLYMTEEEKQTARDSIKFCI